MGVKILAISGSLKEKSSNSWLLKVLRDGDPDSVVLEAGIGGLPFFSPDRDGGEGPGPVADFRSRVRSCDGLVFCTPEYAFAMPGVLKNALDWLVSSGDLYRKPTLALSASPSVEGGRKALDNLLLVLEAQGANILRESSRPIPMVYRRLSPEGAILDPSLPGELQSLLAALKSVIGKSSADPASV